MLWIVIVVVSFALSVWMTWRFCYSKSTLQIIDHPTERSLHSHPLPSTGGIAILMAILLGTTLFSLAHMLGMDLIVIGIGALLVSSVSLLDDRFTIHPIYRLITHASVAVLLIYFGFSLDQINLPAVSFVLPLAIGSIFSLLYIMWMVNLYNFMDGMDGFAGGMAVIGFGTFAALGWQAGNEQFFAVSLVVSAAAAGFLVFNFPPARIFMGDVGSSTLGFLAAAFSLWASRDGIFPLWVGVLIFSPFVVDATVTLVRRMLCGEKIWEAHRTHYYQRLVQLGWGHKRTMLFEYALMALCGISALWALNQLPPFQWLVIGILAVFYAGLMLFVGHLEARVRVRHEQ